MHHVRVCAMRQREILRSGQARKMQSLCSLDCFAPLLVALKVRRGRFCAPCARFSMPNIHKQIRIYWVCSNVMQRFPIEDMICSFPIFDSSSIARLTCRFRWGAVMVEGLLSVYTSLFLGRRSLLRFVMARFLARKKRRERKYHNFVEMYTVKSSNADELCRWEYLIIEGY